MRNFAGFDGGKNLPGYLNFYFIPDDAVESIPADDDGVVDIDAIIYADADTWYAGAAILKTLSLGNELKQTPDGPTYPVVIEGKAAFKSAHNLRLFHDMSFRRFILLVRDLNCNTFLCGEPGNGLTFAWKEVEGALSFTFAAVYSKPCWFATGDVNVDGTTYNVDYIPSAIYVQGPAGDAVLTGTDDVPDNELGNDGQSYVKFEPLKVYLKTAGVWVLQQDETEEFMRRKRAARLAPLIITGNL